MISNEFKYQNTHQDFVSLLTDLVESKKILREDLLDPFPTQAVPFPVLITPLPANIFPNRLHLMYLIAY